MRFDLTSTGPEKRHEEIERPVLGSKHTSDVVADIAEVGYLYSQQHHAFVITPSTLSTDSLIRPHRMLPAE